jgi:hypothetical protein
MKTLTAALLVICSMLVMPATASADWRWAPPTLEKKKVVFACASTQCIKKAYKKALKRHKLRVKRYNERRLKEWRKWTNLFIPTCTWLGESGVGPQFASFRYYVWNTSGSGARGKYQMMPGTYASRAKYFDWSPLDQEIAGHREYFANGTSPWEACH